MNAVVIHFPRALSLLAEKSDEALRRDCRLAARAMGCNGAQVRMVDAFAQGRILRGVRGRHLLDECRRFAAHLLGPRNPEAA